MRKLVDRVTTNISDIQQLIYENDARRKEALEQIAKTTDGQYLLDFGQALLYTKPTSEWTQAQRSLVKAFKQTKDVGIEIIPYDQQIDMRLLADLTGLTKTNDVNLNLSVTESLSEARLRVTEAERELETEPPETQQDSEDTG
jgi:hypothetical protein